MTRFNSANAYVNQMSASHTAVASCHAAFCSTMNHAVISLTGTTLLVSVFAILGILVRLQVIILISVISLISLLLNIMALTYPLLKEPPDFV